jgi:hypothetical protein
LIRHVLLFKFWPDVSQSERETALEELRNLKDHIPEIKEWSIGVQAFPSEKSHDFAQVSSFESLEDLGRFREDPEHIRVRNTLSRIADWAVVDYNYDESPKQNSTKEQP